MSDEQIPTMFGFQPKEEPELDLPAPKAEEPPAQAKPAPAPSAPAEAPGTMAGFEPPAQEAPAADGAIDPSTDKEKLAASAREAARSEFGISGEAQPGTFGHNVRGAAGEQTVIGAQLDVESARVAAGVPAIEPSIDDTGTAGPPAIGPTPTADEQAAARRRLIGQIGWELAQTNLTATTVAGALIGGIVAPDSLVGVSQRGMIAAARAMGLNKVAARLAQESAGAIIARSAIDGAIGNVLVDPLVQFNRIKSGMQDKFSGEQLALAAPMGAVFGGMLSSTMLAGGVGARWVNRALRGEYARADAPDGSVPPKPEAPGVVEEPKTPFREELDGVIQRSPDQPQPAPETVPAPEKIEQEIEQPAGQGDTITPETKLAPKKKSKQEIVAPEEKGAEIAEQQARADTIARLRNDLEEIDSEIESWSRRAREIDQEREGILNSPEGRLIQRYEELSRKYDAIQGGKKGNLAKIEKEMDAIGEAMDPTVASYLDDLMGERAVIDEQISQRKSDRQAVADKIKAEEAAPAAKPKPAKKERTKRTPKEAKADAKSALAEAAAIREDVVSARALVQQAQAEPVAPNMQAAKDFALARAEDRIGIEELKAEALELTAKADEAHARAAEEAEKGPDLAALVLDERGRLRVPDAEDQRVLDGLYGEMANAARRADPEERARITSEIARAVDDLTERARVEAAARAADNPALAARIEQRVARIAAAMRSALARIAEAPTRELIEGRVRQAFGRIGDRLIDSGRLEIVNRVADLPPRADGEIHPSDAKGMFDGEKSWLVAENLIPGEERGVVLHEIGVHFGMESMLGADQFARLLADVEARAAPGGELERFARMVPDDTPPGQRAEEILAYAVESAPTLGVVRRLLSAVRAWMYRNFGVGTLSVNELQALAYAALKRVDSATAARTEAGPLYSRDPRITLNDDGLDSPFRISTRQPSGPRATEDPLAQKLVSDLDAVYSAGDEFVAKVQERLLSDIPFMARIEGEAPRETIERYVDIVTKNLLWLHDMMDQKLRERAKLWYDGARNIVDQWAVKFDVEDYKAAAVIAALSPQKDWFQNVSLGERLIHTFKTKMNFGWSSHMQATMDRIFPAGEKYDELREAIGNRTLSQILQGNAAEGKEKFKLAGAWIRVYSETYHDPAYRVITPEGRLGDYVKVQDGTNANIQWSSNVELGKAVEALLSEDFAGVSSSLGMQHKIRNFYNNILVPKLRELAVTMDTHAVAAGTVRPVGGSEKSVTVNLSGPPKSVSSGMIGTYGVNAEAYKRAAEARGILAREMQSITWEMIRQVFEPSYKSKEKKLREKGNSVVDGIWKQFADGKITLEEAQARIYADATKGRDISFAWEEGDGDIRLEAKDAHTFQRKDGKLLSDVKVGPRRSKGPSYSRRVRDDGDTGSVGSGAGVVDAEIAPMAGGLGGLGESYPQGRATSGVARVERPPLETPEQARALSAMLAGDWRTGSRGQVTPEEFHEAIKANDGAVTLTAYDPDYIRERVADGRMELYRLGDTKVYFALKRGDPEYDADYGFETPEIGKDEVTLVSVVNNEPNARGVGGPAILLKAIEEGATVLDAFAVKSAEYREGFLPTLYNLFGFEKLGEIPFNEDYLVPGQPEFWARTTRGWSKEEFGYPPLAIMKWRGDDSIRANIVSEFLGERFGSAHKLTDKLRQIARAVSDMDPETLRGWGLDESAQARAKAATSQPTYSRGGGVDATMRALQDEIRALDEDLSAPDTEAAGALNYQRMVGEAISKGVPLQPDKAAPASLTRPQARMKIARELADAFEAVLRTGRVMRGALGQINNKTGVMRSRSAGDVDTVAHEIGHHLDTLVDTAPDIQIIVKAHASELGQLVQSTNARLRRREAWAEFFRLYVTAPAFARKALPGTYGAFERLLKSKYPDLQAAVEKAREELDMIYYAAASERVTGEMIATPMPGWISTQLNKVRKELDPSGGKVWSWLDSWITHFSNDKHPVQIAVDALSRVYARNYGGAALEVLPSTNPAFLARKMAGSHQAAAAMVEMGVVDYRGTGISGASLKDAVMMAKAGREGQSIEGAMEELGAYLVARRMVEEYRRFKNGEIPNAPGALALADYAKAIDEFEAANPNLRDAAERVYLFQGAMLKRMYDAEILSREQFIAMSSKVDYVPLLRDMSDIADGVPAQGSSGSLQYGILKMFRGSSRPVLNPIEVIVKRIHDYELLIAQNDTVKALAALAEKAGYGGGMIAEKIPNHKLAPDVVDPIEALRQAAKAANVNKADIDQLVLEAETVLGEGALATLYRNEPITPGKEPILFYWSGGQRQALRLADGNFGRELFISLSQMHAPERNLFVLTFTFFAQMLRAGVTKMPDFILVNIVRDQITALQTGSKRYIPFVSAFRELPGALFSSQADDVQKSYALGGGLAGGAISAAMDNSAYGRDALSIMRGGSRLGKLTRLSEVSEAATRLGMYRTYYKEGKRLGYSDVDAYAYAMFNSQDYVDFRAAGKTMRAVNRYVPFLNASIRGTAREVTRITTLFELEGRRARGEQLSRADIARLSEARVALTRTLVLAFMAGTGVALMNAGNPEYERANAYAKERNFLFKVGDEWVAIPKPFGVSAALINMFEKGADGMFRGDPEMAKMWLMQSAAGFVPPYQNPALTTLAGSAANWDYFRERQIVPSYLERLEPSQQYLPSTAYYARWLGQQTGWSPMKIEYVINNLGGTAARDLKFATDAIAAQFTGSQTKPAQIYDWPIARRFIKNTARGNQFTQALYDLVGQTTGKFEGKMNAYKDILGQGRTEDAKEYIRSLPPPERAYATLMSHFDADHKRWHPLYNARERVSVLNGLQREITRGNVLRQGELGSRPSISDKAEGERYTPDRSNLNRISDAMLDLSTAIARNAAITMGAKGTKGMALDDLKPHLDKVKAADQIVYEELVARLEQKKLPEFEQTIVKWPVIEQRILRDGREADLSDIVPKTSKRRRSSK